MRMSMKGRYPIAAGLLLGVFTGAVATHLSWPKPSELEEVSLAWFLTSHGLASPKSQPLHGQSILSQTLKLSLDVAVHGTMNHDLSATCRRIGLKSCDPELLRPTKLGTEE